MFIQTYLNRAVLTLARALITGGETTEFEKVLSEGLNIVRKNTLIDVSSARPKSRLAQLSLACGPLEKLTVILNNSDWLSFVNYC